jgi:hypothetical protein
MRFMAAEPEIRIICVLFVVELAEVDSALIHEIDRIVGQYVMVLEMLSEALPSRSWVGCTSYAHGVYTSKG